MDLPQNLWNSPIIRQRMAQEAAFECRHGIPTHAHYWFAVPEADTKIDLIELRNFTPSLMHIDPHEYQKGLAKELMIMLNRHIDHDGLWIVGWTHPPEMWESFKVDGDNAWGRMVMLFLDEDGDIQFCTETDLPVADIVASGMNYYVELCEKSWTAWNESFGKKAQKTDFALKEDQQTKKVLASIH